MRRILSFCLCAALAWTMASCTQEPGVDLSPSGSDELNVAGELFMKSLQNHSGWQSEWREMEKIGEPMPNYLMFSACIDNGMHWIIPLVKDRQVSGIAIYPVEFGEADASGLMEMGDPTILTRGQMPSYRIAQRFFDSRACELLKNKGLIDRDRHVLAPLDATRTTITDVTTTYHGKYTITYTGNTDPSTPGGTFSAPWLPLTVIDNFFLDALKFSGIIDGTIYVIHDRTFETSLHTGYLGQMLGSFHLELRTASETEANELWNRFKENIFYLNMLWINKWDLSLSNFTTTSTIRSYERPDPPGGSIPTNPTNPSGGSQPETPASVAPLAQKIFSRNSDLTQKEWEKLDSLLGIIIKDSMGRRLYNVLTGDKKIIFKYDQCLKPNGRYAPAQRIGNDVIDPTIILKSLNYPQTLFHEMFHARQNKTITGEAWNNNQGHIEAETQLATIMVFLKNLDRNDPSYKGIYDYIIGTDEKQIALYNLCEDYLDDKGNLLYEEDAAEFNEKYNAIAKQYAEKYFTQGPQPFSENRTIEENLQFIRELAINR